MRTRGDTMDISSQYVTSTYGGPVAVTGGGGAGEQLLGVSDNFASATPVVGGGGTPLQPLGVATNFEGTANATASVAMIPATTTTVPAVGLQPGGSTITGGGGNVQPTAPVADPHAGHTAPPAQSSNPAPAGPPTQGSSTPTGPAPVVAPVAPVAPPANEDPLDALKRELAKAANDDAKKALYDKYVAKATTDDAKKAMFTAYADSLSPTGKANLTKFFAVVELNQTLAQLTNDDDKTRALAQMNTKFVGQSDVLKALGDAWFASLSPAGQDRAKRFFAAVSG